MHPGPGFAAPAEAFRQEVCAWLTQQLAPERVAGHEDPSDRTGLAEDFERRLQREAGMRGWLGISVPSQAGGGGQPPSFAAAFGYEAAYHDAPLVDTAVVLASAPLLRFATPQQQALLLPRMLRGEIEMCIAYTEPGAGNDLAALKSTAIPLPDGGFRLNGHKTLITGAGKADYCLTVARTDSSAPARRGSSMVVVDMSSAGVSVEPQRTMAGYDLWEVRFADVALDAAALLGERNDGWRILSYAVEHERTGIFSLAWCDRLFAEFLAFCQTDSGAGRPIDQPVVADQIGQLWADLQVGRRSAMRLLAEEASGARSAASASVAKVVLTELALRIAQSATEIAGPAGAVAGTLFGPQLSGVPAAGRFGYEYLFRFDGPVSVGANELHRSGIAAGALGLRAARTP